MQDTRDGVETKSWIEGLAPHHLQMIRDSAIDLAVAQARGYRTIEDRDELLRMGFSPKQAIVPALYVPAWSFGGLELPTIRPDVPRLNDEGKVVKYDRKFGIGNLLDINPAMPVDWRRETTLPLIFTEGSRKVDAGLSAGFPTIGLLGVQGWRMKIPKDLGLALPDFYEVNTENRLTYIAFDSDAITKGQVYQAQIEFGEFLTKRLALVKYCKIPHSSEGEKQGLDDYIRAGGRVQDLLDAAKLLPEMPANFEQYENREDFYYYGPEDKYYQVEKRAWYTSSAVAKVLRPVPTGSKPVPGDEWIASHRPVNEVGWYPGEEQIIEGRRLTDNGWEECEGWKALNTYQPSTIRLGDPEKAGRFIEHTKRVYPDHYQHILDWLAYKVQNPGIKINHALLLGGPPGVGKDTIIESVVPAIGKANVADIGPKAFERDFNPFAKSVLMRVSELHDQGEKSRNSFYEHMKTYIASPPNTIFVNEKHRQEYPVPNVTGVIYTTNSRTGGLWLPEDDRRHFVAWSELEASCWSEGYFRSYFSWLYDEGGAEHVAAWLHAQDLSYFDPGMPPEKTVSMRAMVHASQSQEYDEFLSIFTQLSWPPAVVMGDLVAQANTAMTAAEEAMGGEADFALWLKDRRNRKLIPHRMEEQGYVKVLNPNASEGKWIVKATAVTIYARTTLTPDERVSAAREKLAKVGSEGL